MAAIGSVNSIAAAQLAQVQQAASQPKKPEQTQVPQDSVHISKAALSALGSGDADHDSD